MRLIVGGATLALISQLTDLVVASSEQSLLWNDNAVTDAFPENLYHRNENEPSRAYPCYPKRVHLAQATNVNEEDRLVAMTVSFSLDFAKCSHGSPRIRYGPKGSTQSESVIGVNPLQFNYTSEKTASLFMSDWIYHVELPSLQAGLTSYWYQIQVEDVDRKKVDSFEKGTTTHRSLRGPSGYFLGETNMIDFLTPPLIGEPTTVALVGDIGQTDNSIRTLLDIYRATQVQPGGGNNVAQEDATKVFRPPVSQLLIVGDMSYADSDPQRWLSWMDMAEFLVRSTPLHTAAGNHEIECDTVSRNIFVPYEHWFRNPNRIQPAEMQPVDEEYRQTLWHGSCSAPSNFQGVYNYGNSFYSYQHGSAHIIVLNSYTDCTKESVQYQWLETELQSVFDRARTPWLLVAFHAPLYTTFFGHVDEIEAVQMKQAMEELFVQYGVNIIVSGM